MGGVGRQKIFMRDRNQWSKDPRLGCTTENKEYFLCTICYKVILIDNGKKKSD